MAKGGLMHVLRDIALVKGLEQGLSIVMGAWRKNQDRSGRRQWLKSGAAFTLGASLAAAGVVIATRLWKELQNEGGEGLRRQAGERFEQIRSGVGTVAQDVSARVGQTAPEVIDRVSQVAQGIPGRLEQARERLSERIDSGVTSDTSAVAAEVSDLLQQAQSVAEEAGSRIQDAAAPVIEAAEDASIRLGASESLGHEARRQEIGAEQAVDLEELIASIVPASEGENGAVTAPGPGAEAASDTPVVSNGMKVVAFDGTDIGRVKDVRADGFVLSRPRGDDLLAPLDSIYKIEGTLVYLRIEANQLRRQGWESVPADVAAEPPDAAAEPSDVAAEPPDASSEPSDAPEKAEGPDA